jgi:hypothetical protein
MVRLFTDKKDRVIRVGADCEQNRQCKSNDASSGGSLEAVILVVHLYLLLLLIPGAIKSAGNDLL